VHVLAVDTSTGRGSVAVVGDDGLLAEARVAAAQGHSGWLLPAAEALLRGLGLAASAVDAFAVTTGPGSFTGLRVGLSSVQGLGLASGRPCVGLSTLDVLAYAVGRGVAVVALMDAYRGEVYSAVYDGSGSPLRGARLSGLAAALEGVPVGARFVGDAVGPAREAIAAIVPGAVFPDVDLYLAAPLGRAALGCVSRGEATLASQLRPFYLRGAVVRTASP
jgi:tRNA threonylcarbamoyladenosine biosynthesis protein TsaB